MHIGVSERVKPERLDHRAGILRRFGKHRPVHHPANRFYLARIPQLRSSLHVVYSRRPCRDKHVRRTARLVKHVFQNVDHGKLPACEAADLIPHIERADGGRSTLKPGCYEVSPLVRAAKRNTLGHEYGRPPPTRRQAKSVRPRQQIIIQRVVRLKALRQAAPLGHVARLTAMRARV